MRAQIRPTLALIRRTMNLLDGEALVNAEQVLASESALLDRFAAIKDHRMEASRIRIHGDFHLGQVLHAGRDFVIIDFEGEPSRSPTERRIKKSGLADVAGMLRSFQYAARAGLMAHAERGLVPHDQWAAFETREQAWETWAGIRFLAGYLELADGTALVPPHENDLHALLTAYTLDKALYEVRYDLAHRPSWAHIPLHGIVQILEGDR
jgi:maltose alpha-D-glucosyltransferase/alpha-amylase